MQEHNTTQCQKPFNSTLSSYPLGSKSKNVTWEAAITWRASASCICIECGGHQVSSCQQLKINLGIFKKECSNSYVASLLLDTMSQEHLISQVKTVKHDETLVCAMCKARSLTHLPEKEGRRKKILSPGKLIHLRHSGSQCCPLNTPITSFCPYKQVVWILISWNTIKDWNK